MTPVWTRNPAHRWTVELSQEITTLKTVLPLSQEMQRAEHLQSEGWIRVPIDGQCWLIEWAQWLEENIHLDDLHVCIGCVLFRRGEDAVAYALRWS